MNRFQMMKISILRNVDFLFICPAISCKHTASRCVFVMSNQTVALAHKLNFDEISGRECPKKAFKLNGKVCQQFRWKQKPQQKCEGMCLKKIVFRATLVKIQWNKRIGILEFWLYGILVRIKNIIWYNTDSRTIMCSNGKFYLLSIFPLNVINKTLNLYAYTGKRAVITQNANKQK